jgi:hypothetical protein
MGVCGVAAENSDLVVAMSYDVLDNLSGCLKHIWIQNVDFERPGNRGYMQIIDAIVADHCPHCELDAHLELSEGAAVALFGPLVFDIHRFNVVW